MHRADIDGEDAGTDGNQASALPRSGAAKPLTVSEELSMKDDSGAAISRACFFLCREISEVNFDIAVVDFRAPFLVALAKAGPNQPSCVGGHKPAISAALPRCGRPQIVDRVVEDIPIYVVDYCGDFPQIYTFGESVQDAMNENIPLDPNIGVSTPDRRVGLTSALGIECCSCRPIGEMGQRALIPIEDAGGEIGREALAQKIDSDVVDAGHTNSNFIPLGRAVSAVVMRIENSRLRLKVSGPVREGDDRAEW